MPVLSSPSQVSSCQALLAPEAAALSVATLWLPLWLPSLEGGVAQVAMLEGLLAPLTASGTGPSMAEVLAEALMLGTLMCCCCCCCWVTLLGALQEGWGARAELPMGSRPEVGTTRLQWGSGVGRVSAGCGGVW